MKTNKQMIGHLFALISIIVWGTTFISTKILLNDFTPIEILFYRMVLGTIALFFANPKRLIINDIKKELLFALAGLTGVTLYFLFENFALTFTYASNVGVIVSVVPFFTAILSLFFLKKEKVNLNFYLSFIVAMAGIFLISFNGASTLKLNPLGDILAILAAVVWAIYSIATKKISSFGYDTILVTKRIFIYGIIFIIPVMILMDFKFGFARFTNPIYSLNLAFLGIIASALCFVTWNYALEILGAVKTSVYIYGIPVITVIFAVLILHEKITTMALIGTVLTILGLFISETKIGKKTE